MAPLAIDPESAFSAAAVIGVGALVIFVAWRMRLELRVERTQIRRGRNQCTSCGYDLRASSQSCPECGALIPLRSQELLAADRFCVVPDVQCTGCGIPLRGQSTASTCQACGSSVAQSVYAWVATQLNLSSEQVNFIVKALRMTRSSIARPILAPIAISRAAPAVSAYEAWIRQMPVGVALLNDLPTPTPQQVDAAIQLLIDSGMLERITHDNGDAFSGIFRLDDVINGAITPNNTARLDTIAAKLDVNLTQVAFILRAVTDESQRRARVVQDATPHLTNREVCIVVRNQARYLTRTDAEARSLLERLGITSSECIGRVAWNLVERGVLTSTENDRPNGFDNLYTLDELMAAPAR